MGWKWALITLGTAAITASLLLPYFLRPRKRPMASWDRARSYYKRTSK